MPVLPLTNAGRPDVFDYIAQGPKIAKAVNDVKSTYRGLRGSSRINPKMVRSYNYSTQSQINQLRRAINRNAQEMQTYRKQATTFTRTGTGVEDTIDISLSELIKNDTNFRENVLGDKWRNKYVSLNFSTNVDKLRVVLYKPKETGQSIDISQLTNGLIDHFEPNSFNIMHDQVINCQSTNKSEYWHFSVAKRLNFLTTINSQAGDLVKAGDLRLLVVTAGSSADTVVLSTMMKFQNK
jgi:hypothetical protein